MGDGVAISVDVTMDNMHEGPVGLQILALKPRECAAEGFFNKSVVMAKWTRVSALLSQDGLPDVVEKTSEDRGFQHDSLYLQGVQYCFYPFGYLEAVPE
jgi:hypothetical protein